VTLLAANEHFVRAPEWTWYILFYFFLAGLAGGTYVLASLLRLGGNPADEPAARTGFYVAFPALLICPILLTLDLGQPLRFWHMLVNATPGELAPVFKYWSPMSVGAWGLVIFGIFVTGSFLDTLVRDRTDDRGRLIPNFAAKLWNLLGAIAGLFVAGYTGVLLAVSNQPIWSDTWVLGAVFLASGLSGSAALLGWLVHRRPAARASLRAFVRLERFFLVLEIVLIVVFVLLLIQPGALSTAFAFPWVILWIVAFVSFLPGLFGATGSRRTVSADGSVSVREARAVGWVSLLVLLGVLALRAAVIFSAQ
jgi:formate-dependent nitrite reductase membrane component NrfD